jgi:hypothetical protein
MVPTNIPSNDMMLMNPRSLVMLGTFIMIMGPINYLIYEFMALVFDILLMHLAKVMRCCDVYNWLLMFGN